MKKQIVSILALILAISLCACSSKEIADTTPAEATTQSEESSDAEVTQADIEERIVGRWMTSEKDGQPTLTNEKNVFDIVSATEAYVSLSRTTGQSPWEHGMEGNVDIKGNVVTITTDPEDGPSVVNEFTITDITANEFTANYKSISTAEGSEPVVKERIDTYVRVNEDYSKNTIGTWEGRCTSKGSVFDDGQEHRWEFKDDGTYVYYNKDGDNWVPADDTLNEYFVAGNLLCSRWIENGTEYREWWEITINGDTMNWTALRSNEDGTTFTASFEMSKVDK